MGEPTPKRRRVDDKPVAAVKERPALDRAKAERFAHQALDFAKLGKWKNLFLFLGKHPEVVDVRPALREYALIHQAAWHGSARGNAAIGHLWSGPTSHDEGWANCCRNRQGA